jgi:hypothetical protein
MVQTPGRLPGVAIVLRGGQGTGKTIVYKMLELLFHPFNAVLVEDPDRITGRFNWHLTDKILVCADEALFARDLKSVGPLKSRITAERILFEQKHIDAITLENYIRLIIISNDEHVIHADEDERRYFVLETADTYAQRPGEPESRATARRQPYFDAISKQMKDEGGAEAMMHDLAKRDLSKFDPRVFPDTPFLARQKELSRKPEEQWLWDVVDTQPWFDRDRVRKTTVNDHHESWMKGRKFRHVMNESELGRMLVQMFGLGIVRKLPVVEGGARVPVYCFPPRDEARRILRHEQPEKRAQKFRLRASKPTWSRW